MQFNYESLEQQLRLAAKSGDNEKVQVLVEQGADINASPSSAALTPLMLAAREGHLSTIRLLLEKGADVNKTTRHNHDAFVYASGPQKKEIICLLLTHGGISHFLLYVSKVAMERCSRWFGPPME